MSNEFSFKENKQIRAEGDQYQIIIRDESTRDAQYCVARLAEQSVCAEQNPQTYKPRPSANVKMSIRSDIDSLYGPT